MSTRWDPRVAHIHDGPPSDPDRYRRQAQERLDAEARQRAVADIQEAPERPAPTRPAPRLEPYVDDGPRLIDGPDALVLVIPGQVPLVNAIGERGHYNPDTRRVYNPGTKVRGDYADRVADLCGIFAPRRRDHRVEHDLIVHHLVDTARIRGNPPDAGSVRVAVKGALDGLTRSHNPTGWVLADDRLVNEVMTVAILAAADVLILTLRASTGWPLPITTIGRD